MIPKMLSCRTFVDRVNRLGGKVPADLAALLDAAEAVEQWRPQEDPHAIHNAVVTRKFTAATAADYLDTELIRPERRPGDIQHVALQEIAVAFGVSVAKAAGDEAIESLRPVFERARDAMVEASAWITPNTTAAQVLEAGPEAAAAWKALDEHRRTLDGLYMLASSMLGEFSAISMQPFMRNGNEAIAAFFVAESVDLYTAAGALEPLRQQGRGGRWMMLLSLGQLQWNTVTEARRIVDAQQDAYHNQQMAKVRANHKVGA